MTDSIDVSFQLRLCRVIGHVAYFTTQPIDKQQGEHWSDRNFSEAGPPFVYTIYHQMRQDKRWSVLVVLFYAKLLAFRSEEHVTVNQLNKEKVPLLFSKDGTTQILAGALFEEFIRDVQRNEGSVFVNIEDMRIPNIQSILFGQPIMPPILPRDEKMKQYSPLQSQRNQFVRF